MYDNVRAYGSTACARRWHCRGHGEVSFTQEGHICTPEAGSDRSSCGSVTPKLSRELGHFSYRIEKFLGARKGIQSVETDRSISWVRMSGRKGLSNRLAEIGFPKTIVSVASYVACGARYGRSRGGSFVNQRYGDHASGILSILLNDSYRWLRIGFRSRADLVHSTSWRNFEMDRNRIG